MIQAGILQRCHLYKCSVRTGIASERLFHIIYQWHQSVRSCLKVMMVWSRCTAARTVIEKCEVRIFPCHVKHIHISLPYGLVSVPVSGNHEMVREDRIWIYKNMILLSLASFELQHYLLRGSVFLAEEASSLCDLLLRQLGS